MTVVLHPDALVSDAIARDPEVMSGAATFPGTRVLVQSLFDFLADGETLDGFLDAFPGLRREAALAVLRLASRAIELSVSPTPESAPPSPSGCPVVSRMPIPRPPSRVARVRLRLAVSSHHLAS
jgi:uncharacterized protein (DUF433 family)